MKHYILLFIIVVALFSACRKQSEDSLSPNTSTSIKDLKLSDNFSWTSYSQSQLEVNINSSTNYDGEVIILYDDQHNIIEKNVDCKQQSHF